MHHRANTAMMPASEDTYNLAHTARCKLHMAADNPERNLRFILGHAFTLDKLRLRIAEIEMDKEDEEERDSELNEPLGAKRERRVSFGSNTRPTKISGGRRSPPPDALGSLSDEETQEDDDIEEDDEEEAGLGLQRFESGSAKMPRMIDDEGEEEEDMDEAITPPPMPSEDELRMITGGEVDDELTTAYSHVAGCPCHGKKGPSVDHVWPIPQKEGQEGSRYAVVAVAA